MAGETFDFGEVVRGDEDGSVFGSGEEALDQLVAHQSVESGEGFVEDDQPRMVGERRRQRCFDAHAARQVLQFAIARQFEFAHQVIGQRLVPGGIEGREEIEEVTDGHPARQFLVLGDVAYAREVAWAEAARRRFEDFAVAGSGAKDVHQGFDGGGLAGSVGSDQREDAAWGDFEVDAIEGHDAAEFLGESAGANCTAHFFLRSPFKGEGSGDMRAQWAARA